MSHDASIRALAFSPRDGRLLLTGSFDGAARLWWTATGQPASRPLPHGGLIRDVAFSPDGQFALTASFDHTARLWDVATGRPIGPPLGHRDWVVRAAFSPDGRTVLTASSDSLARIWSTPNALAGAPARIRLWIASLTGTELDNEGVLHLLDADAWNAARRNSL
jgi:WD40 repeat protein